MNKHAAALLTVLLYTAELGLLAFLLGLYKKGDWPLSSFVETPAGKAALAAPVLLVAAIAGIVVLVRRNAAAAGRFRPMVGLNIVSVIALVGTLEVAVRVFATRTPEGESFGNKVLIPKDWKMVAARNRAVLAQAAARGSYLVRDSQLGWTIGRSRESADYNRESQQRFVTQEASPEERARSQHYLAGSLNYLSSAEGLRSGQAGIALAAQPRRRRIALVGDSFTFGLEVSYDQTWGQYLERALSPDFQVLNFGVDGYGVDQSFLRYLRDVVHWQPEIVVLGLITDDLRRTMCVYGFLCFPGSAIPFPKPRFALDADTLVLLNRALPTPDSILAIKSIAQLPLIDYDPAYDPSQWAQHFYLRSYAVRFLLSQFPRWPVPEPAVSDAARQAVNAELIRSFVRSARQNGSKAVVVFFPSRGVFTGDGSTGTVGREILRASGVPFIDLTDCVAAVPAAERFVVLHYSATTNAAVAKCLMQTLAPDRI